MKKVLLLVTMLLLSNHLMANVADGFYFHQMKIEAKTVWLETSVLLNSIDHHYAVEDATKEICYDLGNLSVYIKLLDLSIDKVDRTKFMNLSYKTRYNLRWAFRDRDQMLGACGVAVGPSIPRGDFKALQKQVLKLRKKLEFALIELEML